MGIPPSRIGTIRSDRLVLISGLIVASLYLTCIVRVQDGENEIVPMIEIKDQFVGHKTQPLLAFQIIIPY
jgi:hypothetical protein